MRAKQIVLATAIFCVLASSTALAANAQLVVGRAVVNLDVPDGYVSARLTLAAPDGSVIERRFAGGNFRLDAGVPAPLDGAYRYTLSFDGPQTAMSPSAYGDGEGRTASAQRSWPTLSGQFGVLGQDLAPASAEPLAPEPADQVIADDLIVQGGLCAGTDCVNGEDFNFMNFKLKQNNIRLRFDDTSVPGSNPSRDWQITLNDSAGGGAEKFSIEDITAGRVPFTIIGNAPTNSFFLDATGRIGLGTGVPTAQFHQVIGNTPIVRLEQTAAGGFAAQTWDVAGNETNFFVRDVTSGSRLPLRIRPGAATSSLDIAASGFVGFGTASPTARVHVQSNIPLAAPVLALKVRNEDPSVVAGTEDRFTVDSSGNVTARGTISQLSSRATKEHFQNTLGSMLLAKLESLPVPSWNYRGSSTEERHIGPVAEDFHAAFGVGADPRFLAPADVAGVALASVKALQDQVKERDVRIGELEERLARIEALLTTQR